MQLVYKLILSVKSIISNIGMSNIKSVCQTSKFHVINYFSLSTKFLIANFVMLKFVFVHSIRGEQVLSTHSSFGLPYSYRKGKPGICRFFPNLVVTFRPS